ncbi:unnamed protein product [Parascedosporium putredinis]|uniref:Uncharacterized protein n=1 Tax=Parascedosporium putredinis TaxID=1442378 RepID=A0A9P1GZT4_9PEZI|nr:unnamed protein product [Parascedosporium putredinis]CAI7991147.1 unnamed protein product [Parascedosporium putredinis]
MHALTAKHAHPHRALPVFRLLPAQTATAAALTSRLTRAWPHAFVSAEGYVRLPIDELRTEGTESRIAVRSESEAVKAAQEAATLAGSRLLNALLSAGKAGTAVDVDVETRITPLEGTRIRAGDSLTAFSRFGTGPIAGPTILNKIPTSWKANDGPGGIVLQSVVFSQASRRPVAAVHALLRLKGQDGRALDQWVEENTEVLSKMLREIEDGERRGREEVEEVENGVDALERDTWNRPDAVEDMGTAKA